MCKIANEKDFLRKIKMDDALAINIAGDASLRMYKRLFKNNKTFILAIYPQSEKHCFDRFIELSRYLHSNGFSVPVVLEHDYNLGLMLVEDLGDESFSKIFSTQNALELYCLSIDVLVDLHNIPKIQNLETYSSTQMIENLEIFLQYYLQYKNISENNKKDFFKIWDNIFANSNISHDVISLRDFHSPNLLYLKNRIKNQKIGIIDFQDATICSKIYDIASLINDARIKLDKYLINALKKRYLHIANIENKEEFNDQFDIISTQRNLRILGVFAKQKLKFKNKNYEKFVPILLYYLKSSLRNNCLKELSKWLESFSDIL